MQINDSAPSTNGDTGCRVDAAGRRKTVLTVTKSVRPPPEDLFKLNEEGRNCKPPAVANGV
jgi:hypothetical protein